MTTLPEIKTEESLHIKIPNLENLGTIEEGLASLFVVPETNFPHEMLALIASFIDKSCRSEALELLATLCFFMFCHDLLNSTKLLVWLGDPSSLRIRSCANLVRYRMPEIGEILRQIHRRAIVNGLSTR